MEVYFINKYINIYKNKKIYMYSKTRGKNATYLGIVL